MAARHRREVQSRLSASPQISTKPTLPALAHKSRAQQRHSQRAMPRAARNRYSNTIRPLPAAQSAVHLRRTDLSAMLQLRLTPLLPIYDAIHPYAYPTVPIGPLSTHLRPSSSPSTALQRLGGLHRDSPITVRSRSASFLRVWTLDL